MSAFFLYRPKRIRDGKRYVSPFYSVRFRLEGGPRHDVALQVRDKQAAGEKARKLILEHEQEAANLLPPRLMRDAAALPLAQHLTAYIADLRQKRASPKHCQIVEDRLTLLCKACGWKFLRDITADSFQTWRAGQSKSAKTINEYLGGARAFLGWMERSGRSERNPLARVEKVDTRGQATRIRRAFSDAEIAALLKASGSRSLLYLGAVHTGLRRAELASVTWAAVDLDAAHPTLRVSSSRTKNRKEAVMHLHAQLADELRLARAKGVEPDAPVFPRLYRLLEFKRDLEAAGIPFLDAQGRRADFHAFRHTFCTRLHRHGIPQRLAQELMRHSDPRLTAMQYTDTSALPLANAICGLPGIPDFVSPPVSPSAVREGQNESAAVRDGQTVEAWERAVNIGQSPRLSQADRGGQKGKLAPAVGLEPTTLALTAPCSTIELHRNEKKATI